MDMREISDVLVSDEDHESTYIATYESDCMITENDAREFVRANYREYWILDWDYEIDGNRLIVTYTIDDLD